jgi:hypothetical protein
MNINVKVKVPDGNTCSVINCDFHSNYNDCNLFNCYLSENIQNTTIVTMTEKCNACLAICQREKFFPSFLPRSMNANCW